MDARGAGGVEGSGSAGVWENPCNEGVVRPPITMVSAAQDGNIGAGLPLILDCAGEFPMFFVAGGDVNHLVAVPGAMAAPVHGSGASRDYTGSGSLGTMLLTMSRVRSSLSLAPLTGISQEKLDVAGRGGAGGSTGALQTFFRRGSSNFLLAGRGGAGGSLTAVESTVAVPRAYNSTNMQINNKGRALGLAGVRQKASCPDPAQKCLSALCGS